MQTNEQTGEMVLVTDENYNERDYLASNPDVAKSVREGLIFSGRRHFELYGRRERRVMHLSLNNGRSVMRSSSQRLKVIYSSLKKVFFRLLYRIAYPESFVELEAQKSPLQMLETVETLKSELSDTEILLRQMMSILNAEMNLPYPPPKHLQVRVVGKYNQHFISDGMSFYPVLNRLLRPTGKELKDFQTILDFGCGCGRAIRGLATLLPDSKIHGTDIDGEAIAWLKNNYSKFAEFSVAPHVPPTIYQDQTFDFIFGVSVMTHLPEDMQFKWLEELNRITKPGGYVILSIHGERIYRPFDNEINQIMDTKGFFYYQLGGFNYGKSISLPDFYQTTFHSHAYIRREWQRYFNIIDIQAAGKGQGLDERQDSVLLQKRL